MKDNQDAYGHLVYDYLYGKENCEIVERDDGYIDTSIGLRAYFSECENWSAHQREAMRHVRGRILDIGCGAGRHSLYLQDKGFEVVGIDISPLAVEVCKLRGMKDARVMSITQISPKLGKFDTILMFGNNFGLFGSYKKAKMLLKKLHKLTSNIGRIIAESNDPYKTDNPFHLKYQESNRKRNRMSGQLRIRVRYMKYTTPWFDYLMVSKDEMEKILDGTGWRVARFIDSEGSAYTAVIEKASV